MFACSAVTEVVPLTNLIAGENVCLLYETTNVVP
jgi:hypothetical protein